MKIFQDTPNSSSIVSYSYDTEKLELEVKYKSGVTYRYLNVDTKTFSSLRMAPSVGNFIATQIKRFEYEKLEAPKETPVPPPWVFPKAEHFQDLSNPERWPFPTGPKPAEPPTEESYDDIITWTSEEEEEFMRIIIKKNEEL